MDSPGTSCKSPAFWGEVRNPNQVKRFWPLPEGFPPPSMQVLLSGSLPDVTMQATVRGSFARVRYFRMRSMG